MSVRAVREKSLWAPDSERDAGRDFERDAGRDSERDAARFVSGRCERL